MTDATVGAPVRCAGTDAIAVRLNVAALGLVVLAAGLGLAMPFLGDQALFTLYARELVNGAVLYRDLFDIKQPGIYMFYVSGGLLFGFTEAGIHLFELAYWLGFSVFAVTTLPRYFTARWGAPLVPVFTVVVYYLGAGLSDLTQIEILVAFPVLVAWWLIETTEPGSRTAERRYAAAGLVAAAVVLLKYLYLLIILAFLLYAVLRYRRRRVGVAAITRCVASFVIAMVVPLLIVVAYLAVYVHLERIKWIWVDFVLYSQLTGSKSLSDLKFGARRFMIGHAPTLVLAVFGCVHGTLRRSQPRFDLVVGMMLWVVSGALALSVQGWWDYKWMLFTTPVGILAVIGVESLVTAKDTLGLQPRLWSLAAAMALSVLSWMVGAPLPQAQTWLLLAVVVGACAGVAMELLARHARARKVTSYVLAASISVSVGLAAIGPVEKLRALSEHGFGLTAESRTTLRRALSSAYRAIDQDLEIFQREGVRAGPIHVFGDTLVLFRANRHPAIPFLGQDPNSYDNRAWREMDRDLRSALPPYIVINGYTEGIIRSRNPAIMEWIESRYKVAFVGTSGTWYELR